MIPLNILYWHVQTCTEFNVIERALALMYLGYCRQILYKFIVPLKRFSIFTKRCQITCYTRWQHLHHEWRPYAHKQINDMRPKEDGILIKVLRVEKGHGATKLKSQGRTKLKSQGRTCQLLVLIACCIRLIRLRLPTAAGSVTLKSSERTTCYGMAPLWPAYHWQSSRPVATATA